MWVVGWGVCECVCGGEARLARQKKEIGEIISMDSEYYSKKMANSDESKAGIMNVLIELNSIYLCTVTICNTSYVLIFSLCTSDFPW